MPCFSCFLSHIARIVMCASRLLVHGCEKGRVRAAALINTWISVEPCCTVTGVRKRLQASGIERGRSSVEAHDGGALASGASDMWVKVQGPLLHVFLPPTGEESALDGAEQAAPGVVQVDAAAPWRSEEAAGSISQDTQDTQILLGSCSHLKLSFLFGLMSFLAVSLAVFFLLSWLFGGIYHASFRKFMRRASCSCLVACSRLLTH